MEIWELYLTSHGKNPKVDEAMDYHGTAGMREIISDFAEIFLSLHQHDNFNEPWDWVVLPEFLDTMIEKTGDADPMAWKLRTIINTYHKVKGKYGVDG